jgi:hypothetical protein
MSNSIWKFKTDRLGEWTPAVKRRYKKYEDKYVIDHGIAKGALVDHESRSRFGYNYLEYVSYKK